MTRERLAMTRERLAMTREGLAMANHIRHCEERSDVAIQMLSPPMHWIATLRSR
jgi:hypothetical protein